MLFVYINTVWYNFMEIKWCAAARLRALQDVQQYWCLEQEHKPIVSILCLRYGFSAGFFQNPIDPFYR